MKHPARSLKSLTTAAMLLALPACSGVRPETAKVVSSPASPAGTASPAAPAAVAPAAPTPAATAPAPAPVATPTPAPAPAAPAPAATPPANPSSTAGVLVGDVTREQIEQAAPDWVQAEVESTPDTATATSLASVEPGADVTVFLGTWCGDSRREVPRLWRALDQNAGSLPFALHYIAVDHNKKEPKGRTGPERIDYVPTFIVRRGGQEVGRIVEQSPNSIERDLLDLLTGRAHGVVSSRTDLQDAGRPNG